MKYGEYQWCSIAKDYNSLYLRNHLWTASLLRYQELLDLPIPAFGIVANGNVIDYISDMKTWEMTHEALKSRVVEDYNYLDRLIDRTISWGENFNRWTDKNIFQADLASFSEERLIGLLQDFINGQSEGYVYGTAVPVLDFHDFSFVEGNLHRFLQEKGGAQAAQYYSALTEPLHNSFAQDQEEDLLRLMAKYYSQPGWREDVCRAGLSELKSRHPAFSRDLMDHAAQHGWVYYVYMGPAFTADDFLGFIKDYLNKGVVPEQKMGELLARKQTAAKLREECLVKLQPRGLDEFILKIAGKVVWAKPRRKDYQSRSYYHVEKLMQEIARRLYLSLDQARSLPTEIIIKALRREAADLSIANEIIKNHACLPDEGRVIDLVGREADNFWQKYQVDNGHDLLEDKKNFQGVCACPGQAKGRAKVINMPLDMPKMAYGDILVSSGTTPSIVPAMKKAAAIITDEGGLTCHAAIVSRELGIPCVVSLRTASRVIKDGDELEVDALRGIVKRL